MTNPQFSSTAFVLLCMTTATMILRPGEMIPPLGMLPIYEVLILGTLLCAHQDVFRQFKPESLVRQPVALCLVGTFFAIPVSHLTHLYFGGAFEGTIEFTKSAMLYVLVIVVVDRWSRFERLTMVIACCAIVMIFFCVIDYLGFVDLPFIRHVEETYGQTLDGNEIRIARMNGTGIFSDPNDISLLITATTILCASFLTDRERGPMRVLWLLPIMLLLLALLCTKSRGGILAIAAATCVLLMFRYGKGVAIALAVLGVLAAPVVLGRQANIDLSEGTGHARLLLWREGLVALRSKDLFFGTGHGTYGDIAGLVAHNSFVHAYVELGIVGGTFFFGMFFFCAWGLLRLNTAGWRIMNPRQARFLPYMAAIGSGWSIGLLSLSRCYTVSTLLILAMGAAFLNLAGWNLRPRRPVLLWDQFHIVRLAAASLTMFVALNIFVRVMT